MATLNDAPLRRIRRARRLRGRPRRVLVVDTEMRPRGWVVQRIPILAVPLTEHELRILETRRRDIEEQREQLRQLAAESRERLERAGLAGRATILE